MVLHFPKVSRVYNSKLQDYLHLMFLIFAKLGDNGTSKMFIIDLISMKPEIFECGKQRPLKETGKLKKSRKFCSALLNKWLSN